MDTYEKIQAGKMIALISFIFETTIFVLYFLTMSFELIFVGYALLVLTVFFNIIVLLILIYGAIKDKVNRKKIFLTGGLMFMNIPVIFIYGWITLILINTMIITFTNTTDNVLTDINISGCETEYIDKLEIGESETVWIEIPNDCSISIDYLTNGKRNEEVVAGYVTNSMGQKMNHKIGGFNDIPF